MRVSISAGSTSASLSGVCDRCGDCCRSMCKTAFMLNEEGICRFLGADNLCDIQARRVVPTDEQLAYWRLNCETFPSYLGAQDGQHLLPFLSRTGWPSAKCGYKLEVRGLADST